MVSLGPYRSDPGGLPELSSPTYHLQEIDTYIVQAKERSYETVLSFGKRGLNIAASAAVQAATKVPLPFGNHKFIFHVWESKSVL